MIFTALWSKSKILNSPISTQRVEKSHLTDNIFIQCADTNFPEPTRPPHFTFREDIPLINQIAGVHRLLKAPHKLDDCALELSHNGSYLDLESTLAEQRDELEGFQEDGGRGKKHSIILRTQLSVRINSNLFSLFSPAEKLYNSTGRELRRALFSLKQIFQVSYA
uniref:FHOD1 N-terminal GTPase-binding domain-containing protein n=1 Tax=Sinocyclocheilus anshuiensis TaxID=1608454 RepID=A0A671LQV4_9TELE